MSLEDWFESYEFENGKIFVLDEVVMPGSRRARGVNAAPTSVHQRAIPVVYGNGVSQVPMMSV